MRSNRALGRERICGAREPIPYLTFRSLARTVAAEAEERKEILVKHGLVDSVLGSLTEGLGRDRAQPFGQAGFGGTAV
jgi:hypothetical protein